MRSSVLLRAKKNLQFGIKGHLGIRVFSVRCERQGDDKCRDIVGRGCTPETEDLAS